MRPWKAAKVTEPKLPLQSGALCRYGPAFKSASRKLTSFCHDVGMLIISLLLGSIICGSDGFYLIS